jgi:hypothetical protein
MLPQHPESRRKPAIYESSDIAQFAAAFAFEFLDLDEVFASYVSLIIMPLPVTITRVIVKKREFLFDCLFVCYDQVLLVSGDNY